jgi:hypothetical protein
MSPARLLRRTLDSIAKANVYSGRCFLVNRLDVALYLAANAPTQCAVMQLPNADRAQVDRVKVTDYLLSATHPDGRGKAAFFEHFGFKGEDWEVLAAALREVGVSNPVSGLVKSQYGARYTVDGAMRTPSGSTPMVRTVWVVEPGRPPRLVTAYPL